MAVSGHFDHIVFLRFVQKIHINIEQAYVGQIFEFYVASFSQYIKNVV